jgi:hypothetical protein
MATQKKKNKLIWNEILKTNLLHTIHSNNGHIDGSHKTWTKINLDFFNLPDLKCYKSDHFIQGDTREAYRKLKDQMKIILNDCLKYKESGNLSAQLNSEPSALFKYAETISLEVEDNEEEEKLKAQKNLDIENSEAAVMAIATKAKKPKKNNPNPLKTKSIITGETTFSKIYDPAKKIKTFETILMEQLSASNPLKEEDKEEKMEIKLIEDLKRNGISSLDNFIPQEYVSKTPLGIELRDIVGVYCTRNENFSKKNFEATLSTFGFLPFPIHRLYTNMQVLRQKIEEAARIVLPVLNETPTSNPSIEESPTPASSSHLNYELSPVNLFPSVEQQDATEEDSD